MNKLSEENGIQYQCNCGSLRYAYFTLKLIVFCLIVYYGRVPFVDLCTAVLRCRGRTPFTVHGAQSQRPRQYYTSTITRSFGLLFSPLSLFPECSLSVTTFGYLGPLSEWGSIALVAKAYLKRRHDKTDIVIFQR